MEALKTTVTKRGQTVIPAALRKQYGLSAGDSIAWIDTGTSIKVLPLPVDPIAALRGSGAGEPLVECLLAAREEDRGLETRLLEARALVDRNLTLGSPDPSDAPPSQVPEGPGR